MAVIRWVLFIYLGTASLGATPQVPGKELEATAENQKSIALAWQRSLHLDDAEVDAIVARDRRLYGSPKANNPVASYFHRTSATIDFADQVIFLTEWAVFHRVSDEARKNLHLISGKSLDTRSLKVTRGLGREFTYLVKVRASALRDPFTFLVRQEHYLEPIPSLSVSYAALLPLKGGQTFTIPLSDLKKGHADKPQRALVDLAARRAWAQMKNVPESPENLEVSPLDSQRVGGVPYFFLLLRLTESSEMYFARFQGDVPAEFDERVLKQVEVSLSRVVPVDGTRLFLKEEELHQLYSPTQTAEVRLEREKSALAPPP